MYKRRRLSAKAAGIAAVLVLAFSSLISCSGISAAIFPADTGSQQQVSSSVSYSQAVDSYAADSGVEYYFPREGQDAKSRLIEVIRSAQKTLDMAIYSFTDSDIASELISAENRGVSVRVISDKEQSAGKYQKTVLDSLKQAGIPIRIDTHTGLMHLKVTIADAKTVTTGSFNYTNAAETKNDEVFVVLNDVSAAQDFDSEFEHLWDDNSCFTDY